MPRCKGKGQNWERSLCVSLSFWVTSGRHSDVYWRSATSGARATQRAKKEGRKDYQSGDISAISPEGHAFLSLMTIEAKATADVDWATTCGGSKGKFGAFWEQALEQTSGGKTEPLLIIKANRRVVLAFTTAHGFKTLQDGVKPHQTLQSTIQFPHLGAIGFIYQQMLTNVSHDLVIKHAKKQNKTVKREKD